MLQIVDLANAGRVAFKTQQQDASSVALRETFQLIKDKIWNKSTTLTKQNMPTAGISNPRRNKLNLWSITDDFLSNQANDVLILLAMGVATPHNAFVQIIGMHQPWSVPGGNRTM